MEPVTYVDLEAQYIGIRAEVLAALEGICKSGRFAQGPATTEFEAKFADYCEAGHCVSLNSGTSALHLALRCLDVGPGDEVITVAMTFIATAWAISYVGATPVFVDIDPSRRTMDPAKLETAITPQTKAIIPVHLYGTPAEMNDIKAIADRHGLPIIEDAAQAHGARYRGKRVGQVGQIACFSFYPSKNLGAYGEGGALITNDTSIAQRARSLRVANAFQRSTGERERFIPCRFAKHFAVIRGIDGEFGGLRNAGSADQRLGQAMRMLDVVEAEAALDAQPRVVRGPVAAVDAHDCVIGNMIGDLAADAAIGTYGADRLVDRRQIRVLRRRQRAGRAGLHAFAAGDARRFAHRIVHVEDDRRMRAAKRVADHVVHLLLAAGAHAARALDAGVEIDRHRRMRQIGRRLRTSWKARRADAEHIAPVIELGIDLVHTLGHVGGEKLQHHLLGMTRAFACTLNVHAGRRSAAA